MGMSAGGGGGRAGRGRRARRTAMSEINVTPMVDVMLVLLIVFMVAAPMLTAGVPIDLPETSAKALAQPTEPISVSIDEKGKVYLQDKEINPDELIAKLTAIAKNGVEDRINVRGAKNADYGTVMKVMAKISTGGFKKIGLVTTEENGGG